MGLIYEIGLYPNMPNLLFFFAASLNYRSYVIAAFLSARKHQWQAQYIRVAMFRASFRSGPVLLPPASLVFTTPGYPFTVLAELANKTQYYRNFTFLFTGAISSSTRKASSIRPSITSSLISATR